MTLGAFFKDRSAIEGMPMRITVTLILFSIILGLSAKALFNFTYDNKEKKLMGEINLIEKRAAAMYIQGGARAIPAIYAELMLWEQRSVKDAWNYLGKRVLLAKKRSFN